MRHTTSSLPDHGSATESGRPHKLISRRASGEELRKEALRRMPNMAEDALQKAVEGLTTLEEAFRVVPFEDLEHVKANGLLRAGPEGSLRAIGATATDPPPDVERAA